MPLTLTAPMCEAGPVRAVEREIGYRFSDDELLRGATHTWHRLFGPLEHLGDAIADLAVGLSCHRVGLGPEVASRIVDNAHLESVLARRLRRVVRPRTGDVIEALVGAVHLDGGFDHAARVTSGLLMPDVGWRPIHESAVASLEIGAPDQVWLGALVLDAVLADDLIRRRGPARTSQRELSRRRSEIVSTSNLDRVINADGLLRETVGDVRGLKSALAATLLAHGWAPTSGVVLDLLGRS
ncbi:MAG: hypothetical protein ACO3VI_02410 [Ilumatobacteraceae bacterium]